MKKVRVTIAMLVGVSILAATIYVTVQGITKPSTGMSIAIALLGSIGVPIGLGAFSLGWRWARGLNASEIREESEVKRRLAAALEDAEAAETIKAEMEAFVAIRAKRLEIDRRRGELTTTAHRLVQLHQELMEAEAQLDLEATKLSPKTHEVLDELIEPRLPVRIPDFFVAGFPAGRLVRETGEWAMKAAERRQLRRHAQLAPSTRAPGNDGGPDSPVND